MCTLKVVAAGPLSTVQDRGRPGLAALGVGQSGAADRPSHRLANRLVGNDEDAAVIEVTFGGLELRAEGGVYVALTGAPCPMVVRAPDEQPRTFAAYSAVWVPDGATLSLGVPSSGLRSYLAVRGGIAVPEVLQSRSTDMMAGIGPDPLAAGMRLPVGAPAGNLPETDLAPVCPPEAADIVLRVVDGPRADWFTEDALDALVGDSYKVTTDSNRVGMRLSGPELTRSRTDELSSEGMVCGALQVPPTGQPTLFLADHPVTGGYPVVAVVLSADIPKAAQARPGQRIRFVRVATPGGDLDD
ncbi:biotin-dependent carboxyltransferase family protein [Nocardioides sp. JQ2195]|uniref:5-oxoprolinase subunit C family protein n=1 Tax=Nocardioides sp. JQ2195 TaxID=2592334 RepID=UPI00143E96ED|nr:biotin-dependent carboxyltransferase family protein [Nocardioides sp. JQ2195]QIX28414.1 biotin-dependent carboxyltransferase family protein [Nocardioides sp. JQ2195]